VHLLVGGLVCCFVLSPALFTPHGFGLDYQNHLWLIWHQALAIENTGHPTLYEQSTAGIFEPFYGFYGGTLYAVVGGISALLGGHVYPVYIASIGASAAAAYGGMWWLSRQLGLSRWVAHLPAFVAVTAAYYLTDAFARGAWPEFVAISAVPMFVAGALRLLSGPWRAWPVALFAVATVFVTGSHNITLLWCVLVLGPVAVAIWLTVRTARPPWRVILALVGLTVMATGINAWFLLIDVLRAGDTFAWTQNLSFLKYFGAYFYFDNVPNVLDPLRRTPVQSTTYGLAIGAPVAAFCLGLILVWLSWPQVRRAGRGLVAAWLILLGMMAILVGLMVMPREWWSALGAPLTSIQFPYRLAGWLLLAIAVQLAISLRFARGLSGARRGIALGCAAALVVLTIFQASAQMYAGPRLDGATEAGFDLHARTQAFINGPSTPPTTYYASGIYADSSQPLVKTAKDRVLNLPTPPPGATTLETQVRLPPGGGPIATNIAAGPYAVRIEGVKWVGRSDKGMAVVEAESPGKKTARIIVSADAGALGSAGVVISILCLLGSVVLVALLALRRGPSPWPRSS
jgi:hypothetical protein